MIEPESPEIEVPESVEPEEEEVPENLETIEETVEDPVENETPTTVEEPEQNESSDTVETPDAVEVPETPAVSDGPGLVEAPESPDMRETDAPDVLDSNNDSSEEPSDGGASGDSVVSTPGSSEPESAPESESPEPMQPDTSSDSENSAVEDSGSAVVSGSTDDQGEQLSFSEIAPLNLISIGSRNSDSGLPNFGEGGELLEFYEEALQIELLDVDSSQEEQSSVESER